MHCKEKFLLSDPRRTPPIARHQLPKVYIQLMVVEALFDFSFDTIAKVQELQKCLKLAAHLEWL
jgi:hypothetical protein